MKKSKVIVPAMALLLFSTAASVTSTVAWFTSTRTFTSQAGKFAVTAMGNLECAVTEGIATNVATNLRDVEVEAGAVLGDASYDLGSSRLVTDVDGGDTNFEDLGPWAAAASGTSAKWKYGKIGEITSSPSNIEQIYYFGATWTYTFSYTFGAESTDMNLFFDINRSDPTKQYYKADGSAHGEEEAENTCQGFRLAFQAFVAHDADDASFSDTGNSFVWAPFRSTATTHPLSQGSETMVKDVRYVERTTETPTYAVSDYAAGKVLGTNTVNTDAVALGDEGTPLTTTGKTNYLATFDKDVMDENNKVQVLVKMTAWYEGTDPSIVTASTTKLQQVSSSLVFATRQAA